MLKPSLNMPHETVRKLTWGYAADEKLDIEGLIREEYIGIRPAPGYPASPDHTEKRTLFDWLSVEKNTGIRLTENFAMTPPSSVSGLYFAHPESKYFAVGKNRPRSARRICSAQGQIYRRNGTLVAAISGLTRIFARLWAAPPPYNRACASKFNICF